MHYMTPSMSTAHVQSLDANGMKVAKNGMIVATSGYVVDMFNWYGTVILRVATNFTVTNMAFAGKDYKHLLLLEVGGFASVTMNLEWQY